MRTARRGLLLILAMVVLDAHGAVTLAEDATAQARAAVDRGIAFLLATQHPDGSWGSHDPVVVEKSELGWDIKNSGAHQGVTNSVTALAAKALLCAPAPTDKTSGEVRKAADYLLSHWKVGYAAGYQSDAWSYAYTLDFLLTLATRPEGAPFRGKIRETIPRLIQGLASTRLADGGWAYYTKPGMGNGSSFATATVLTALARAKAAGYAIPKGLMEDAARVLESLRIADGSVVYDTRYLTGPSAAWETVSLGGSCRTQAANVALHEAGRNFTAKDLAAGLDYFVGTLPYLEAGRKRLIPHKDAPHAISGYFFFYGYHYAAEAVMHLTKTEQERFWSAITDDVLRTQEKNGSWWDTICYDYGDKWGTAFALLTLERFLETRR